jgi:hemerythrin
MPFIEWTQKHSVAVPEMDDQHRRLFALTNELHDAMRAGQGRAKLSSALDQLTNYTMQHFAAEEQWMKRISYPQLGDHIVEHRRLMQQVEDLRRRLADGDSVLTLEVMDFLRGWLNNHILGTDAKYAQFKPATIQ